MTHSGTSWKTRGVFMLFSFLLTAAWIMGSASFAGAGVILYWRSLQPTGDVSAGTPVIAMGSAAFDGKSFVPSSAHLYVDGAEIARSKYTAYIYSTSVYFRYVPSPVLTDGPHTFRVQVSDTAGAVSQTEWTATVKQAPAASWVSPLYDETLYTGRPSIKLSLSDNTPDTTLTVSGQVHSDSADGPVVATFSGTGLSAGTNSFALEDELVFGTYYLTASVTDAAGNQKTLSGSLARKFTTVSFPAMTVLQDCGECHADIKNAHPTPPSTDCGVCHPDNVDDHMEGTDYCEDCHWDGWHTGGAGLTVAVTSPCYDCHNPDRPEVPQHTAASVAGAHDASCSGCHVTTLIAKHSVTPAGSAYAYQCDVCHASDRADVVNAIETGETACSGCHFGVGGHEAVHTVTAPTGCDGQSCHSGTTLTEIHLAEGSELTCGTCHDSEDPAISEAIDAGDKECTTCHGESFEGHTTSGGHAVHLDAEDPRGPGGLACNDCHEDGNFPAFASGADADESGSIELGETDVCDACHSPGGSYDGVDSTLAPSGALSVGAKDNWASRVYETTSTLSAGKERWCAGCHDGDSSVSGQEPSHINGVYAPGIAGNEASSTAYGVGYGYYTTGHGVTTDTVYPWTKKTGSPLERMGAGLECIECHDTSFGHIDGLARTYDSHSSAGTPAKYQAGYRLKSIGGEFPLEVPRTNEWNESLAEDFRLCLQSGCHISAPHTDEASVLTNFRQDGGNNYHYYHLEIGSSWPIFQSDWDSPLTGDSGGTCIVCHNVHGSTQLAMVNDGALVGREPGIQASYVGDGASPPGLTLPDSVGMYWELGSGFCATACHSGPGWDVLRDPFDPVPPEITYVLGQTGSATLVVAFSEGVYADTGATGDLATSDFALVDLDDGRTITGVTHTAGDPYAILTLSSPLDSSSDLGADTLAAVADSVYDDWGNLMDTTPVTILGSDGEAPTLSIESPSNGATDVPSAGPIEFEVSDTGSGVDFSTLSVQLTGDRGYSQTYTAAQTDVVSNTGAPAAYSVVVQPDQVFGSNELISVVVDVDDYSGISLTPPAWSFTSVDSSPPAISGFSPANGATDVPATSTVSFTLEDSDTGVDLTSLSITLTGSKGFSATYDVLDTMFVTAAGSPASYAITVNTGEDFASQEIIAVGVEVSDIQGNAMEPPAWAFTAVDHSGVESIVWTTKDDFENNAVVGPDFIPGTGDDGTAGSATTRTAVVVSGTNPADDASVGNAEAVPWPTLGTGPMAHHSAAVLDTGECLAWGDNNYGQVGVGDTSSSNSPRYVLNPSRTRLTNVAKIARGSFFTVAVMSSGEVMAWGRNNYGQLGNGTSGGYSTLPVYVETAPGVNLTGVVDVACGGEYALALLDTGEVMAWGRNSTGQLGDDTSFTRTRAVYVKNSAGTANLTGVSKVACMESTSLGLLSSGQLLSWGSNYYGNLGIGVDLGTVYSSDKPVSVRNPSDTGPLQDVTGIAGGQKHGLAVLTSGEVVAWGEGQYGRLGDGREDAWNDGTDQLLPAYVKDPSGTGNLTGASAVAGGSEFSLALMSSGEVMAWGHDSFGQLGDGGSNPRSLPDNVEKSAGTDLSEVVAISTGNTHALCISSSGEVLAWGNNNNGRLGDGTTTTRRRPVNTKPPGGPGNLDLEFYPDPGVASGFKVDTGAVSNWTRLSWRTDELPPYAMVSFRVRTSSDGSAWSAWNGYSIQSLLDSVGGSVSLASVSDSRWLEIELSEESYGVFSPTLTDFTLDYSSDFTAPVSSVTTPTSGATVPWVDDVTIAGTSSDTGGTGVVRVDVSTDNGVSWYSASRIGGTWDNWTYLWEAPLSFGPHTVLSRAVDAAGNVGPASSPVLVTVE